MQSDNKRVAWLCNVTGKRFAKLYKCELFSLLPVLACCRAICIRESQQAGGREGGRGADQAGRRAVLIGFVRCVIFFILFRRFGRSDSLLGYPHPRTPPLPPGAQAPGSGSHTPVRKFLKKIDNFVKSGIAVPGLF